MGHKSQRMLEPIILVVDRTEHHFLNGSGEEIRISFHEIKKGTSEQAGMREKEAVLVVQNEVRNGKEWRTLISKPVN